MNHPVQLVVEDDLQRNRLTVFFRLLLAIPHFIWMYVWNILATIVSIVNWFATLFTGRSPLGLHRFLERFTRYQTHVFAYLGFVADPYPPFLGEEGSYPVDLRVAQPEEQNRLTVFFRLILWLPAGVLSYVLNYLSIVIAVFAWFVCLALGRMPEGMRNLQAFSLRYHVQAQAYLYLLTPRYPSLNVGLTT
jgi:Domain of unknown function (DUF4389)